MRKLGGGFLSAVMVLAFAAGPALATKPGETVNPNGFPSGEHYNLNIHGKQDAFTCPEQEYQVDELGNQVPVYGSSIFIPEVGSEGIRILTLSGSQKGKAATTYTEFRVTDPCTGVFGGANEGAATLEIPPNDKGYNVYARALATPTDDPSISLYPGLQSAVDELGNTLFFLGTLTKDGWSTSRSKGPQKAVDITGLFEYSGTVCYLTSESISNYCAEADPCTTQTLCCTDATGPEGVPDGIFESCAPKEGDLCPDGTLETTATCKAYTDEWVFNIAELVSYFWDIGNNGVKLLQVRFYPVR